MDFYRELTTRNAGVISAEQQEILRTATVLIAGCGSIGGAAVEPLARLGVQNFVLADPGRYELNNLNRQSATVADLDRNKAEVAAERVRAINPGASVTVYDSGVTAANAAELTARCQVIVDGVDVTTAGGWRGKYALHQQAVTERLPLVTGWDMAGAQYVRCYDYRKLNQVFDGRLSAEDLDRLSMWQLLQRILPPRYVPAEMITIARANLENPDFSFPQLVYSAITFGALSAHVVTKLLTGEPVRTHIYTDLHQLARPLRPRWSTRVGWPVQAASLLLALRNRPRTSNLSSLSEGK